MPSTHSGQGASSASTGLFPWGMRLKEIREAAGLTQQALADRMSAICSDASLPTSHWYELARAHFDCAGDIANYDIARFESDPKRLPIRRGRHKLLVAALLDLGAGLNADAVNEWLELGEQGWLTQRERLALFGA